MTCIVGLISENRVFIGGDSAGVVGTDIVIREDKKVFKNGEFLIGFSSSFRMGQLLQFKLKPSKHPEGMDTFEYMVTHFVEDVRKTLKDGGYTKITETREQGGKFLVGYRGRLFQIESDFQVGEHQLMYDAIGSGTYYALASFYNTENSGLNPKERIIKALETAAYFSNSVASPFVVESI